MSRAFRSAVVVTAAALLMPPPGRGGSGEFYETTIKPNRQDKFKSAEYRIWIPDGAKIMRAVIVHQHGCGRNGITVPYDVHWQTLAKKWD